MNANPIQQQFNQHWRLGILFFFFFPFLAIFHFTPFKMSRRPPLYTTANGINRLAMSEEVPSRSRPGESVFEPLPENEWIFTTVRHNIWQPSARWAFKVSANCYLCVVARSCN